MTVSRLDDELFEIYQRGPAPVEDDDVYQRWLRATVATLVASPAGASHAIESDDERQWVERAVMEGAVEWSPGAYAVVLGPRASEVSLRDRPPYETWLHSVHAAAA